MNRAQTENNCRQVAGLRRREESFRAAPTTPTLGTVAWQPDQKLTLKKKNPNWWDKPKGNIDEVVFTPIKSPPPARRRWCRGEVDFVVRSPP